MNSQLTPLLARVLIDERRSNAYQRRAATAQNNPVSAARATRRGGRPDRLASRGW